MKKNITEIKRNLVDRLFTVLHLDYNECTIYIPGIENIVPGANGITIKRLENYDYKTNKTSLRYKLHVVTINDANHYDWETIIAKFDSLDPDTRKQLERFINAKCDNAPAADIPTTFVGHAYYYTLEGREKENTNNKNNKAMKTRVNKYTYYKVLQSNSGYGWDDEAFYDKSDKEQLKELKEDRKAYQVEGIRTRVIERRELN